MTHKSARQIREGLSHPVIDADGHQLEFERARDGTSVEAAALKVLAR